MAKYIGTITSDARGKVGGLVLTRGSNGTNLKAHAVGVNVRSPFQMANRQSVAQSVIAWRLLTDANRTTWSLLAAQYTYLNSLAQAYTPTGLQLWTQAFVNAATLGTTPPPSTATTPPSVAPVTDAAIIISFPSIHISVFNGGTGYTGAWSASISTVIRATVTYMQGTRRRPMAAASGANTVNIGAAYLAAWGPTPQIGDTVNVRVVPFDPVSFVSGTPLIQSVVVT
jgi:hypothetical protein